jgi:hypothetical protein
MGFMVRNCRGDDIGAYREGKKKKIVVNEKVV